MSDPNDRIGGAPAPGMSAEDEAAAITGRLAEIREERRVLARRLAELNAAQPGNGIMAKGRVTANSPPDEKVALFRSLFRGREDVFARRWSNPVSGKSGYAPACANEWVRGVCGKPAVRCGNCPNQAFIPMSDAVINSHLRGIDEHGREVTVGVYPLLNDETCWFLAVDFDRREWQQDAAAFLATCLARSVPATLERSRSGNGGHVWLFFAEPVPARLARALGSHLLTETLERNPDLGFRSYDRFFPNQDTMPAGGFGNLIALPLQHRPRQAANSLFLDDDFRPCDDQWDHLSSLPRMTMAELDGLVGEARRRDRVFALRLPLDDDEDRTPWLSPPSGRRPEPPVEGPLPQSVTLVLGDRVYIDRAGLPPALVTRLVRLAAFRNPEFHRAQARRFSTHDLPRVIACAELLSHHVALPRGCLDRARDLLSSSGTEVRLRDERNSGRAIDTAFLGELTFEQSAAADSLLKHDTGVLAATTGFGKTVVAASVIASRATSTLVLVHRRQLLDQWISRLNEFLDLPAGAIGQVGGGKRKPTGIVDVAILQSLVRKGEVDDIVADYGHLVVDECHHLSARSFEMVAHRCKARNVLGLTATIVRKDGHHPIIFMQCGPVRFRVNAKTQAAVRPFGHRVILRPTGFRLHPEADAEPPPIQQVYTTMAEDGMRNRMIVDDVLDALRAGRSPVVLTERRDHAALLARELTGRVHHVVLLHGGANAGQRRQIAARIEAIPDDEERLLIATGRYIGEGFDDARLDTLFLTMPVSWRGTLAQYVGRLHREHSGKHEVIVHDYVDSLVPVLERMSARRIAGYRGLGYSVEESRTAGPRPVNQQIQVP